MAISTEITWSINSVDRDLSDGFIYKSHWTMTGVAKSDGVGIATATCSGHTAGFGTVRPSPMIAYNDVTQANVITWTQTAIGSTEIAACTKQISERMSRMISPPTPTTGEGVPW